MLSADDYTVEHGARRYEMWEASEASRAGLAAAVDLCRQVGPVRIAAVAASHANCASPRPDPTTAPRSSTAPPYHVHATEVSFPQMSRASTVGPCLPCAAADLRQALSTIRGVRLRDSPCALDDADAPPRCAIVTFDVSAMGLTARTLADALAERHIAVSVSPSIHSFDPSDWERPDVVRVSPSYFNTQEELERLVSAVREIVGAAR
jgi:hypothetical protein